MSRKGPKPRPQAERFWAKVKKTRTCWLWTASVVGWPEKGREAYGRLDDEYAHRISWRMHRGEIPAGAQVLHRCDRPRCVRPGHLFLGTQADNVRDMTAKGRNVFQHRNPSKKLGMRQVYAIRRQRAAGGLLREIGARFGVAESTVSLIARGLSR